MKLRAPKRAPEPGRIPARLCRVLALALLGWLIGPREAWAQTFQDYFTNRETFTAASGVLNGDNSSATVEPGEPRHGGKPGGHSLWISWVAPTNGVARFKTETSGFDTLLSAYAFATTNATNFNQLVELARDDDSEELGSRESKIEFGARAGQRFEIAVDGYFGATGTIKMQWSLDATPVPPPTVVSTPPDATLLPGVPVTLGVLLTNIPNGTKFKWYFNGVEQADEKATNLVIASMQATNVGHYKLQIDLGQHITYFTVPTELQINTEGADALAQGKILDAPASPLVGSTGARPLPLGFRTVHLMQTSGPGGGGVGVVRGYNGSQIFNTTFATVDPAEPVHCSVAGGASYWLMYQPPVNGTMTLDTAGSSYDTVMEVYTFNGALNSYADLISVACDNDAIGPGGASRLVVPVLKPRPYVIVVAGVNGAKGTAWLNYSLNTNLLPQAPAFGTVAAKTVVPVGGNVLLGPGFSGSPPLQFSWRKDDAPIPGANLPFLAWPRAVATNSGTYLLTVSNDLGSASASLVLRVVTMGNCALSPFPGGVNLSFATWSGQFYTIEQADTITGPWLPASATFPGDGQNFTTNLPAAGCKFFRYRLE